jgi:glycosyltransferase involved in cell wall biosynthesis
LQDHVRYRGAPGKAELMGRLREYDAMLFPTWYRESFGFIVAEAAVAGCIPVMTFGIGASEWFLDDVDCLKSARDPASLQAAMLRIIAMPPETRLKMRQRAHATALRLFRFEDALSAIEAALEDAAAPPSRPPRAMEAALAVLTEIWRTG